MIVEHTRFFHLGYTCVINRDHIKWPANLGADDLYVVLVDGRHVGAAASESSALQLARSAAQLFAEKLHHARLFAAAALAGPCNTDCQTNPAVVPAAQ